MSNPGSMDRRIMLQRRTVTRDAAGGVTETWADQLRIWAEIPKQQGGETLIADTARASDTRQFIIRSREIASDTHRIRYQSRTYDIRHIGEVGRENRLLITAVWNQSIN